MRLPMPGGRVLASLAVAAALAALAAASSSRGQIAAPKIAYEQTVGRKNAEIWVMNADGSSQKKLAQGCCFKWSPDGSQIAFHRWWPGYGARSGPFDLFVIRAGGTRLVRLARTPHGTGLAWSPDGTKIVFSGAANGIGRGSSALYLVNADGSGLTALTTLRLDERDVEPAWSPDGKKIAFARAGEAEILIVNADGTDLQVIKPGVNHARNPTWSPDGSRIAFQAETAPVGRWDIFVMNSDGSAVQALTKTPRTADEQPRWSPDGRKLVFSSLPRGSDSDVHSINADGKRHADLTRSPKFDGSPDWSPDGKSILFSSSRDGSTDIYVMSASGRQPLNLTNGSTATRNRYPAWSGRP